MHPSDPRSTPPSPGPTPAPAGAPGPQTGAASAEHPTRPTRAPKGTRDSAASETLPGFHRGMDNLETIKVKAQARQKLGERIADFFTRFSGSMLFVYLHAIWFGVWIPWNLGWIGLKPFDPFPFGLLTMVVSLEAIFLSTFVLISQNREQRINAIRDEIQTEMALYEEQELTQVLRIVHRIEKHLGLKEQDEHLVRAMERFVDADSLFREIEDRVLGDRPKS